MRRVSKFTAMTASTCVVLLIGGVVVMTQLMPRINGSASLEPGPETRLANEVRERWIAIHAQVQKILSMRLPLTWPAATTITNSGVPMSRA